MPKVLIQFAHPALSKSRVQKTLIHYCQNIEGVTFNDLYEQYPDLYIDIKREKELLLQHDIIILQHPFFWYSGPAIIKQWLDLALEYNWAYGPNGKALIGKKILNAISCGSRKEAYSTTGLHQHPLTDFLLPFKQTASLCKMEYLPPFVIHSAHKLTQPAIEKYGEQYAAILKALVSGIITTDDLQKLEYLNDLHSSAGITETV